MTTPDVDTLIFDVFGTVVDWRSGVIRDGERLNKAKGMDVDWAAFADAWREEYQPSLARVRQGETPWRNLDALHWESLEQLLERFGVDDLSDEDIEHLNHVWHRLDPWPDTIPGLNRLRTDYLIAPLSNGHIRLLTNMAKRAGIPWDLILSAELSGHYKPDEEAYLTAVDLLDLQPAEVMMVAAHERDLEASREVGLRTAYIHRPLEWGPERADDTERPAQSAYDVVAEDIVDLAEQLGSEPIL